jgi:hypothetical protein
MEGLSCLNSMSKSRTKLQELLSAGHADDVLSLGAELMKAGQRQVESSHGDGETGPEISSCMPVIAKALRQSSLPAVQKLVWATDAVLKPVAEGHPLLPHDSRKAVFQANQKNLSRSFQIV